MNEKKLSNVRTSSVQQEPTTDTGAGNLGHTMQVTDARNRTITVKKLNPLERMRLARVVGSEGSTNAMYFGYAMLAASVAAINGEPEPFPMSVRAIEATIAQLDDAGIDAVGGAFAQLNGATNTEEDVAHAKN